jgi:hypothetical protein
MIKETPDIFGIADSTVLAVNIIPFFSALILWTYDEGNGRWKVFLRGGLEDR